MATTDYDQLSLGELGRRLASTVSDLVEKQVELAKQEVREDLQQNVRAAISLAAGAGLLLFAAVCLLILVTDVTANLLFGGRTWLGALLWLVIFAILGAIFLLRGKGQLQIQPLGRTRATVKEDLEWAKQRLKPHER